MTDREYALLTIEIEHRRVAYWESRDKDERTRLRAEYEALVDQLPQEEQRHYRGRIAGDVFDSYEVGMRLAEDEVKEKVAAGT